ncbi:conserved hypothetical protein [Leishmania infantum JPCM5]|uniref:Uncharacterized protein n=2 Tax=Leishmania infantum TaxID=5671 RepID=A4I4L4_LEIIN|nr:conserved hypothetical protein [Leishmania infantum JPCM5]CAC9508918.1 hypothetical_protein_-_conserved [Leishmania infantum]CAM69726.1 conserved hypothetical protein [Leishmania infantum JPCM5]SUZ43667.1 hypothetical_protein_-_conserved [Leishmania infantum]|eukprot:XP_001466683.1 conserved hypothetical protein [Leishmania infantum JPCM5]
MAGRCDAASPLPLRAVLRAHEVVAAGRAENVLQVPSPIYTAIFVDAHHALIGAGGGGRRFGMPNIALLLRVQSLGSASKADPTTEAPATSSAPAADAPPVWSFAAAVDLGPDNIPWCTSSFLPFEASAQERKACSGASTEPAALDWSDAQRRVLDGLVGFVALSTVASFLLLGVFRGPEPSTSQATEPSASSAASAPASTSGDADSRRYLRQLARIEVPSDAKNPDKKPIALVQNLVLVSHDDNGVLAFALTDLVPDSCEDEDLDAYTARYADQTTNGASGAVLQRRVPRVRTEAAPVASWQLPARVNDLSVNRVCIVKADASNGASSSSPRPCKAHLQEHLVVAALLLNKTLVLSTVRLRRRYTRSRSHKASAVQEETTAENMQTEAKSDTTAAATMSTALTLTENMLPLPFKLMTSSLRLVRLFGWGDIDAAQQADMRRRLTWQSLQAGGAPTHGPLCGIMVAAYNSVTNESYVIHGAVEVMPLTSSMPSSCTWDSIGPLCLKVQWTRKDPAPVLSDAITSLAVYTDGPPGEYATRVSANPLGAAVPTRWIAGTVEGWVASLRLSHDPAQRPHWQADQIRPSPNKSVARRYPALHKEPVSCVAVSSENDVVSADIAQNVALTTLPYAVPRAPSSATASPSSKTLRCDVAVQPRSTSSSPLFPPAGAVSGGLLGSLTDNLANGLSSLRVAWFLLIPLVLLLAGMIISRRP